MYSPAGTQQSLVRCFFHKKSIRVRTFAWESWIPLYGFRLKLNFFILKLSFKWKIVWIKCKVRWLADSWITQPARRGFWVKIFKAEEPTTQQPQTSWKKYENAKRKAKNKCRKQVGNKQSEWPMFSHFNQRQASVDRESQKPPSKLMFIPKNGCWNWFFSLPLSPLLRSFFPNVKEHKQRTPEERDCNHQKSHRKPLARLVVKAAD